MAKSSKVGTVIAQEDDWRAESDLRSLMEADAIKADPKRHAKAKDLAKKRMMESARVAGAVVGEKE